jgi:hypothetical protein
MEIGESRQRASLLDKIDRRRITRDRGSPRGSRLVRGMSLLGHWRRFGRAPITSDLLQSTDIFRPPGLVRLVPTADLAKTGSMRSGVELHRLLESLE